ncbi:SIR2 family protein [Anaeromyxobacter paludicola]|uniref:SIR2-like domain-containing protein n=1 Tax=Anaeromyxobacter paludicola TaxID=2918171 RepID=A0ABM7XCR9_9BACT|nr:SIR2 family protein [Anaeromyxobacter paludicola]BDG09609.1 hypothetical protein AMPC_27220 [Anaeromyxobacter paludicola]
MSLDASLDASLRPALDHLRGRLARGQLLLLVGAGASRWAGLPGWKELACALAAELAPALRAAVPDAAVRFRPPGPDDPLPTESWLRIGETYRRLCGEDRLRRKLAEVFATAGVDAAALPLHRELVRLSRALPALYTTNFDDLLERAFREAGEPVQVVADARDLDDWKFAERGGAFTPLFPIYKLHGTLDRPETVVLGEADYQRRLSLAAHPIDLRFASDVIGRDVLFVGYSFSDPNVRWIWSRLGDLGVQPKAWFLELGESSDLDVAWHLEHRIRRLDLRATDRTHPAELVEFLAALRERPLTPPSRR